MLLFRIAKRIGLTVCCCRFRRFDNRSDLCSVPWNILSGPTYSDAIWVHIYWYERLQRIGNARAQHTLDSAESRNNYDPRESARPGKRTQPRKTNITTEQYRTNLVLPTRPGLYPLPALHRRCHSPPAPTHVWGAQDQDTDDTLRPFHMYASRRCSPRLYNTIQ